MPRKTKIERHPDYEEVVNRLVDGESPQHIAQMLRDRYPKDKSKWLSHPYLYTWRKKHHPEVVTTKLDDEMDLSTKLMILTDREPPPPEPRRDIPSERLLQWIEGIDGFNQFVEDMIIERGSHVKLQDYQTEMAEFFLNHSRVCICAGGQVGKDFMIMCYSIWWALLNPGSSQLVLCSTQTQSAALMDRTLDALAMDAELEETKFDTSRKPEHYICFKNGARIYYLTAKSRIAGKTNIALIWINEARDIREEEVTRVSPLLGIAGGKLFVLSRPRFRRGYFWECYSNPHFETMKIQTDRNKYFDKQVYEDDQATLSPDLFRIEYLAEFADAGSAFFSEMAIDKCSKENYDFKGMFPDLDYDYALGIDWARLRDTAVQIVVGRHKKTGKKRVFHIAAFAPEQGGPSSFDHQFNYIRLLDNEFRFKYIIPESSGMGMALSEQMKKEWLQTTGSNLVQPYENRSIQAKLEMYSECKRVIERGEIDLPRGAFRLLNELKLTQFGTTLQGVVRVETPITNDYSDALCLALMAFKKSFEIGVAVVKREFRRPKAVTR